MLMLGLHELVLGCGLRSHIGEVLRRGLVGTTLWEEISRYRERAFDLAPWGAVCLNKTWNFDELRRFRADLGKRGGGAEWSNT